ncbi:MAG: efflux transporter outer membrane subunit [Methylotenera sp.]|nr:efflux transporter outer membrane subunit [Methylotenera sp.]
MRKNQYLSLTFKLAILLGMSLALAGCASFDFMKQKYFPQDTIKSTKVAPQWQAALPQLLPAPALPHDGKLTNLQKFWQQYQDPVLLEVIEAAEKESANIATAKAKITEARTNRINAKAALLPTLDGNFSASRSVQQPDIKYSNLPTGFNSQALSPTSGATNSAQIGAQAAWELDLFGANRSLLNAAKAREDAAQAGWHDARVSIAAEAATSYFNLRFCEMQLAVNRNDAKSRAETARLTEISKNAGFSASGELHLAQASAADANQQLKSQQAQCDLAVKELVALTDLDETVLKQKLQQTPFNPIEDNKTLFTIAEVPAQVIAQRPDIYSAEVDLISAAADIRNNQAARLPKVSLNGSIGYMHLSGAGFSGNGEIWSLGPISITLPIFDGGKRKANVENAEAKYEEAAANYRSKVRNAVKEVENALVTLHSTQDRHPDVLNALNGYEASFAATKEKVQAGFANLIELEENRRNALQALTNSINLLKERNNAWITLYRAVGGGWQGKSQLAEVKISESGLISSPTLNSATSTSTDTKSTVIK